ncbi:flavin-binding monooxygenase [Pyrenophora tritici-repentis]|uniref:Uncharacterized protein n=1 Tax=Pyrenophora tritici-repentis TaxID=45151 RepID=A0A2W1GNG6_9PLEO|nr:hypothetical protein PtrV1_10560 [Pyrenophora tritici-repentis]KAF7446554.1 hypothetical protein A1F99_098450 [Pyrenophora tritici-repentis]KAF7567732.1 hypothetical protein PtrM4_143230 [Pyrenophora tritici-repentis]KAG9382234.1 hypothetical protein A1F94_007888 [Pyrenophora tritici-repentis]KAI0569178.1 hypothetical protein Alg215_11785 [Pyrenophora tritici-repentis]
MDNFYSSLTKPNCTVIRERLIEYTENGIISEDTSSRTQKERAYDVIIFGTGFNAAQYLEHEKIEGLSGIDLQEQWKLHPEALYGLAFGLPNKTIGFFKQSLWERLYARWTNVLAKIQEISSLCILQRKQNKSITTEYS